LSFVSAVKEAIETGLGDYWMLNLPDEMKNAYYSGFAELRRERRDESSEYVIAKAADRVLKEQGIRGLCF